MVYNYIQMNSWALIVIIVMVALVLIAGVWWIDWHPHPRVF